MFVNSPQYGHVRTSSGWYEWAITAVTALVFFFSHYGGTDSEWTLQEHDHPVTR